MPPFFISSNYIVYIFFLTFLSQGQLVTGTSKAWLGGFGEIGKPYSYTHPSTKQCNYAYTHPSTKQCDAAAGSHTHTKAQITDFPTTMTPTAHTHAASDVTSGTLSADRIPGLAASKITSGTLSVARGGTGVTANPSMLVNLGSTSAASVFAASPRPGVTGTLPVARGGTGVTTIDALKSALGIVSGGCKMAYGSGVSLSGLSFTPYVAILIGQYSASVTGYYTWVAIKGYDTKSKLCCVTETNSNPDAVYCSCTFSTSGVTFEEFNSNFRFYDYDAYICAFGM